MGKIPQFLAYVPVRTYSYVYVVLRSTPMGLYWRKFRAAFAHCAEKRLKGQIPLKERIPLKEKSALKSESTVICESS